MSTAFRENQDGGRVLFDIAGSYPTGIMAALGQSYNDQQLLINAQLRYNATQLDINSQKGAEYASTNIQKENTATLSASSLSAQLAAKEYENASSSINYINRGLSDDANTAYAKAHAIYKLCSDASYVASLSVDAAYLVKDRVDIETDITSLGISVPDVNPIDKTNLLSISTLSGNFMNDARNNRALAQSNALQYLLKTQGILANAIVKSTTVTNNLEVALAFNKLVKAVIKNLADPLYYIAGKELLVTQYVPSPPLQNAIDVANTALTSLNSFIQAASLKQNTSATIISSVLSSTNLATSLDQQARLNDNVMYNSDATINALVKSASIMRSYGSDISFPSEYTLSPTQIYSEAIDIAENVKKVALHADISAVNARSVSKALIFLRDTFLANTTPDSTIAYIASESLKLLTTAMASVTKVTSNSSPYSAIAITLRASNTVNGILAKITLDETTSNNAHSDAKSVLTLLKKALDATVVVDITQSQIAAWAVNAATDRAREVSEVARDKALLLSKTANNHVTPQNVAVQTAAANSTGNLNNNNLSRLDRNSRYPKFEPIAYKSFQADIRAETFHPVRPSLDELVYKNRITPLRLNSMTSICDTNLKVAQQVQRIKDNSKHSFRQQ